ncbi:beta strand repeat-containing protein [Reyranella sp.]|uniref:beta strand repeat-containing protein n=1 Tax=Reyranella sp. TaxID=1929291 RepID=UPI003BAD4340
MASFIGTSANETFDGTEFNDTAIGNGGNDTLNGNGGDDTLHINGRGTSAALGGTGSDTLIAEGGGAKSLFGGEDDDYLYVGGSANGYGIYGGDGFDTLGLYGTTTIDLSSTLVADVEAFVGTDSDDAITLSLEAFTAFGTFDGDGGSDVLSLRSLGSQDVSDVTTGAWFSSENIETLRVLGGTGDDQLRLSVEQFVGVNRFNLGQGLDVLHLETAGDVDFTISFPRLFGVETLILTGTGSVRMNVAQHAKFTSVASDIFVTVADTGVRLQHYTPAQLADMAERVDMLDATNDVLALTVAKLQALGPIALAADDVVTLADTGANLAALTATELAAAAAAGIDKINATDNALSLTVEQYRAVAGTIELTAKDTVTLADTAAALGAMSASDIAALAGRGVDRIDVTDNALTWSLSQIQSLGAVKLTVADTVTVAGIGAEIGALTPAQLSSLSAKGVDRLEVTDGALTLTKAQALALRAMTLGEAAVVVVADSGLQLTNLTPAQILDLWTKGVDRLDAISGSLILTVAKYDALHDLALTANDVVSLTDSGANISALTASAIAALAAKGIDRIDAADGALTLSVAQYRALGTVALTLADHVILADTAANLAALTPAENAALASKGIDEVLAVLPTTIETTMASYTLDSFANNLRFIGTGPFSGTGNDLDNVVSGGDSGDTLSGLAGNDTLAGGNGDDILIGGLGNDILSGGAGSGDYASYVNATTGVTASLANPSSNTGEAAGDTYISIERLAGSSFNDTLVGDAGANTLRGNAGADVLNGGAGSDYASYTTATMGLTASLSNPGINTGDAAGDTYISIESLAGSNFDDILVGDASDNTFQGNLGADQIDGGAGFDYASYFNATTGVTASLANAAINAGEAAGDTYAQIEGLTGSAFADILVGNGGDNWLLGGGGADKLDGGSGFDTAGYGNSTIALTVSLLDPSANTGEAAGDVYTSIEGVSGSSFNDILIGNAGANTLSGGFGNDSLSGGDGNDQLIGGSGDDFLEGGAGADVFNGGDGTDTVSYYQYSVSGGAGVIASLENASINTGDATGDTYVSVENLAGTFWNDTLIGTSGNNVIDGVNGTDVFNGRGGMDTLIGSGGGDTFVFDSVIGAGNLATISGFVHGQDHFNLDNAIFTQLGAEGALGAGAFVNGAAALDANDRIIFNTATGNVSYDADGSGAGAAVVFATMQNLGVALDHTDFMIV